jgi:hypothetical protein
MPEAGRMSTPMVAMLLGAVCWVFRIAFIVLVPAGRVTGGLAVAIGVAAASVALIDLVVLV